MDPEKLDLITEVGWPDHGTDQLAWMLVTGPGVLNGSAAIAASPSGIYLTLRTSMAETTRAGVETHEVIKGLIDHPAFGGIIPTTQPGFTANRTIPREPNVGELRVRDRVIDLSSISGFVDPAELDLDLTVGTRLGTRLFGIVASGQATVAHLSALSRDVTSAARANRSAASVLTDTFPALNARRVDKLFADLIQSHD
jgi:hypothetical protein